MGPTIMMAKVEGARQAAQIPLLAGKSFTIAQVTTGGNGMGNMLFLTPNAVNAPPGAMVALKLNNVRTAATLKGMVGKSVTVAQSPIGAPRLLVLKSNPAVAKAAVGAAEGLAGKGAAAGKVVIGGKSAAAGQWLVAQPSLIVNPGSGIAMQGFALVPSPGQVAVIKGGVPLVKPVAMTVKAASAGQMAGAKVATATTVASKAVATKAVVGGVGLGLTFGVLGPVMILGSIGLLGAGAYRFIKAKRRSLVEQVAA